MTVAANSQRSHDSESSVRDIAKRFQGNSTIETADQVHRRLHKQQNARSQERRNSLGTKTQQLGTGSPASVRDFDVSIGQVQLHVTEDEDEAESDAEKEVAYRIKSGVARDHMLEATEMQEAANLIWRNYRLRLVHRKLKRQKRLGADIQAKQGEKMHRCCEEGHVPKARRTAARILQRCFRGRALSEHGRLLNTKHQEREYMAAKKLQSQYRGRKAKIDTAATQIQRICRGGLIATRENAANNGLFDGVDCSNGDPEPAQQSSDKHMAENVRSNGKSSYAQLLLRLCHSAEDVGQEQATNTARTLQQPAVSDKSRLVRGLPKESGGVVEASGDENAAWAADDGLHTPPEGVLTYADMQRAVVLMRKVGERIDPDGSRRIKQRVRPKSSRTCGVVRWARETYWHMSCDPHASFNAGWEESRYYRS
jgi:hypothetical protein